MSTAIRPMAPADIEPYVAHLDRVINGQRTPGEIVFSPHAHDRPWRSAEMPEHIAARWASAVTDPEWERAWGIWDGEGIVGHLNLRSGRLVTEHHRCVMGMGLESPYRGQGLGRAILETAIAWARQQRGLDGMDLVVFAQNEAGLALYRRCGFAEIGRRPDAYRIGDRVLDDVMMALRLRP